VISKVKNIINYEDFDSIDIRIGTIISAVHFKNAIKPAYQLLIDFGSLGELKSSAQITELYLPEKLIGKQIVAAINIGQIKISNFISQCLVLGVSSSKGVSLLEPNLKIQNGSLVV
jgi:tRNA-binding protein|tara:strand:+ start:90 stop:437 length:348 start_codon:yes stop_codon:yes gene_type:complete